MSKPTRHRNGWRIRWMDANGVRRSGTFATYNEAERKRAAYQAEADQVRKGLRQPTPAVRTMNDAFDAWERDRVPIKRSGANDVSIFSRHLRPFFGALRLDQINQGDIDRYVTANHADGRRPRAPKTITNHVTLLIAVLRYAQDLGWLLTLPRIRKPTFKRSRGGFHYLTTAELARFLEAARADDNPIVYSSPFGAATLSESSSSSGRSAGITHVRRLGGDLANPVNMIRRSGNGRQIVPE